MVRQDTRQCFFSLTKATDHSCQYERVGVVWRARLGRFRITTMETSDDRERAGSRSGLMKPAKQTMKALLVSCVLLLHLTPLLNADSSVEVSSSGEVEYVNANSEPLESLAAAAMNETASDAQPQSKEDMTTPHSFLDEEEDFDDDDDDFLDDDDEEEYDSPMISPDDMDEHQDDSVQPDDDGSDLGEPQGYMKDHHDEILAKIEQSRAYMEQVRANDFYEPVHKLCVNKHADCSYWAVQGECDNNPKYMRASCAPACQSCEMLHVRTRCPKPGPNETLAMYPGDLDRMFHRLLEDPEFEKYEPRALSRPDFAEGDTPENADYALGMWLVVLENIVNEEEANRMIELANIRGYERSADVGEELEDGTFGDDVNEDRTSTNAWCEDECYDDPVPQKVMRTIEHVTGIPMANQESLQQLRYEVGQFYKIHNDFIEYQVDRPGGPRIL